MASQVALTGGIYLGPADLTTYTDNVQMGPFKFDAVKMPTFGSGGNMVQKPGLFSIMMDASGFNDFAASALDQTVNIIANGRTQYPFSAVPGIGITPIATGDRAFMSRGVLSEGSPMDPFKVGDAVGYRLHLTGDTAGVRGYVGLPRAARTTTTTGAAVAQAGPTATQNLYAALHVFAATGTPTLDVTIQSDDNAGFTTPTTRITFTQATIAGGAPWYQFATPVPGNWSTETHLRALATIGGGTPNIDFAVFFAVM